MTEQAVDERSIGMGPPWLHAAMSRARYDGQWLFVAGMMLLAATTFFGWRGLAQVALTTGAACAASWVARSMTRRLIGSTRRAVPAHVMCLGALVGLSLPMMLNPAVPVLLGLLTGLVAGLGRGPGWRLNVPALGLVVLCFVPAAMTHSSLSVTRERVGKPTNAVLNPNRVLLGNVADAMPDPPAVSLKPWIDYDPMADATRRRDMALLLSREQRRMLTDRDELVNLLRNHDLARMGELFLGAVPGPIGATSPVLLIAMGMYLFYRRLASWRMAVAALATAVVVYGVMPIYLPEAIPFAADLAAGVDGVSGRWSVVLEPWLALGPAAALTFLGYLMLATPWCLVVLILAPLGAPMSRAGRVVYGVLLGIGMALCQWWLPVPEGVYVALLMVSLFSRPLDGLQRSRFARV